MANFSKKEREYMERALKLAAKGRAAAAPNPMVGAVVVKDGRIIGEGYHERFGASHAEVIALEKAGQKAAGGAIYLNLEPCSHYGKTPPCALKIIKSGIKKAVIAVEDPNPKVAGRGIKMLQKAGIEVKLSLLKKEAEKLNEAFFKYIKEKLPFVYLKKAQTLDGYIAASSGDSKWITNTKARLEGHKLRHQAAAIMVGIGTVLADDPSLTARLENKKGCDPLRIVLDPSLKIPLEAKIINQKSTAKTLLITAAESELSRARAALFKKEKLLRKKKSVEIMSFKTRENNYFRLPEILKALAARKISSLLVEGGARLSYSFLKENLVDKFYYFIAPKIYGGSDGAAAFAGKGPKLMEEAVDLEIISSKILADNLLLIAKKAEG